MMMLRFMLLFCAVQASAFADSQTIDFQQSANEYANALDNVQAIAQAMEAKLNEISALDSGIQSAREDLKSLDRQAESLRQEAQDVQNAANDASGAGNQPPGGGAGGGGSGAGGGGGSGAGGGGGGKGGGMEGKEPPKLGEAPKFEMPPAVAEQSNLGDIMGKLGFTPGRGINGSPTEFTGSSFDPNAFRLGGATRPMTNFSPADVASGNLPQLQGGTSVGNPIADQNALAAANAGGPTPGAGGSGMMGGMGGGGLGAGGGAAAGGDSLASVGALEDEGPSPKINTETMATGSGGEGGDGGGSVSTTGDAEESPVARQRTSGGDTIIVASERGIVNPEAHGLMTYVGTGFLKELCGNKSAAVGVCLGPLPASARTPVTTVTEAEPEMEAQPAGRGIASVPDVTPAQASVAPQRSEKRAGILGLLSGK